MAKTLRFECAVCKKEIDAETPQCIHCGTTLLNGYLQIAIKKKDEEVETKNVPIKKEKNEIKTEDAPKATSYKESKKKVVPRKKQDDEERLGNIFRKKIQ